MIKIHGLLLAGLLVAGQLLASRATSFDSITPSRGGSPAPSQPSQYAGDGVLVAASQSSHVSRARSDIYLTQKEKNQNADSDRVLSEHQLFSDTLQQSEPKEFDWRTMQREILALVKSACKSDKRIKSLKKKVRKLRNKVKFLIQKNEENDDQLCGEISSSSGSSDDVRKHPCDYPNDVLPAFREGADWNAYLASVNRR